MRMMLAAAVLVGGLGLVGAVHTHAAAPQASSLILYRSAPSTTANPAVVHLWTTDERGRHAREVISLKPVGRYDAVRAAYLVPDGIILATPNATDGNLTDIGLVRRDSNRVRLLFSVRGLFSFRPSPDGQAIAYSRSLPVAGRPLLVIARRDGKVARTLLHTASAIFGWSSDGRRVFTYCDTTRRRQLCAFSRATGASTAMKLRLENVWAATPSVSPSGTRIAFPEAIGPAGERIYTTKGTFLHNIVGHTAGYALWSPDETQLLLQPQDDPPLVFSFKTKRVTPFAHDGPADLRVLDWS